MRRTSPSISFLLALYSFIAYGSSVLLADNWPQWRGPNGDGTTSERGLPTRWSKTENVVWRLPLPGPSGATPAIWGEHIFLTSLRPKADYVLLCVSRSGDIRWTRKLSTAEEAPKEGEGNASAPSPTTDGKHVWAFTGLGDLVCYDLQGTLVWQKNLQREYGEFDYWFGMSTTPLVHGDDVYQMVLQMKDPYIIAFDKLSGKERWKHTRESNSEHESRHSYASPILYEGKRTLLLIHGGDHLTAHTLDSGAEVWRLGSLNDKSEYNRFLRFVASPVAQSGLVVVPTAKNYPILAVRPGGTGNVTKTHTAWRRPRGTSDVATPTMKDGLVYMLRENGVLICIDTKTGKDVYEERVHKGDQRSSPVWADGKLFCAAKNGVVHVVKPGRKFEVIASNDMQEQILATPAIAGGRIYLRTFNALYAIEATAKTGD